MAKQMIPPNMWTEVPGAGWVLWEGMGNASVEVDDDGAVNVSYQDGAGDFGRFSRSLTPPWESPQPTDVWYSDGVLTSGESLAPDQGEEKQ